MRHDKWRRSAPAHRPPAGANKVAGSTRTCADTFATLTGVLCRRSSSCAPSERPRTTTSGLGTMVRRARRAGRDGARRCMALGRQCAAPTLVQIDDALGLTGARGVMLHLALSPRRRK